MHARQLKDGCWLKDMLCPPPLEGYRSILAALKRVGCKVWCDVAGGGTIVNIGARLPIGSYDDDIAWDTFRRAPQFRMVAFEGNNASMGILQRAFPPARATSTRVQLVHRYVESRTIAAELKARKVSPHFALLKIDIDSIDLPVVCAILAGGFRPTLIMAEYNQWTPPPIEFAALELRRGEEFTGLVPSYQANFRGRNREWPCAGTSLASWARFASEFGYSLLQLDRPPLNSNILMLRSDLHAKHFSEWSTDLDCHLGAFKHWGMVRLIPFDMYARMSRAEKGVWGSELPGHPHPRGHELASGQAPGQRLNVLRLNVQRLKSLGTGTVAASRDPTEERANGHWVFDRSYDFAPATATMDSQCRFAQTPYLMRLNHTCCPLNASDSPLCRGDCEPIQLGTVAPADAIRSATALRSWLLAKKPRMVMSSRLRDLGSDPK